MCLNIMVDKCIVCGKPEVNSHWSTKQTFFCSFKCYAMSSVKLLLLLSFIFSVMFIGFGTWIVFTDTDLDLTTRLVLLIPFITAEILGPIPGFVIAIIGFFYNRNETKEKDESEVSDKMKK